MPARRNKTETDEMLNDEVERISIQLDRMKLFTPKHVEEKIVENIAKKYEALMDAIWLYHYERTEEFFNELEHTLPATIQKQQNKLMGILLLGLAFLASVVISVYLYARGLPDAGRFFIYPAVLSLIMFVIVLFKKEGDYIARKEDS